MAPQGGSALGYGLMGMGALGMTYMLMSSSRMATQMKPSYAAAQSQSYFHPEVQRRVRSTIGYFSASLGFTGVSCYLLRNNAFALTNPWMLFFGTLASIIGMRMVDGVENPALKHVMLASTIGFLSLGMVPLIQMAGAPILYDAMLATGVTVGSFGGIAYNAPSEQFLQMRGALTMGCGILIAAGFINMFRPMPWMLQFQLYGGLALFSAFVLYDVQKVIHNAKTKSKFDPIDESFHIYYDTIIIFQ
jgi:FtsH-binding integral membrane protein